MASLRIYIISNLYPIDNQEDYYGVFVRNFVESLSEGDEIVFCSKSLIRGRGKNALDKILKYLRFYIDILVKGLFSRFDLIYVHNVSHSAIPLRIITLFRKRKIILNPHGEDIIPTRKITDKLLHLALPLIRQSKMVVPSNFFKKHVTARFNKPSEDVYVYPSGGVDTQLFSPRPKHTVPYTCIGFVSRLDEGKGWKTYLFALKALISQNFSVKGLVVGKGDQVADFFAMVKKLDIEAFIDYTAGVRQDELSYLYRQMDVFVFPTEFHESLGLVGLEAMACGIPVIGSCIGGLQDYIKADCNGFFIAPGDSDMLTATLKKYILSDTETKVRLSLNARHTAMQFDAAKSKYALINQLRNWNHIN